jgi:hypothetical protein
MGGLAGPRGGQAHRTDHKEKAMAENSVPTTPEDQAAQQTGQRVQLRIDETTMQQSYANMVRTNATPEEVILDFGVNSVAPGADNQPTLMLKINQRVIMNYYSAKRLAITLGQIIRRHEEQFGDLELDVAKRQKK